MFVMCVCVFFVFKFIVQKCRPFELASNNYLQQVVWHQTRCKQFLFFCPLTSRNNVTNALAQINKTIASSPFHCRRSWAARVGAIDAKYMSRNENNYANICKPCLCSPPIKKILALTNCFFQFVTRSILKQTVSCLRNRWWYQDRVLRRTFPCAIRTTLVFA